MVLKGCSYMGASPHRLHVPSAFDGGARFEVDANRILPQSVLAAITLVESGAGEGGARTGAGCEMGHPFCSAAVTDLSGVGSDPKLLEQKP